MGIFSPKDKSYLNLYKQLANHLIDSSKLLVKMVSANSSDYKKISDSMRELEEIADAKKREIAKWIANTFVTPFDRDDMYVISSRIDDVIDGYDKAIDIIYLYDIQDLPKKAEKQVGLLEDLAIRTFAIISGMSDIRAHSADLEQLRELVIDSEKAHRALLAKLFSGKSNAVEIIKTKGISDALVDIAESFKSVAAAVEQIAVKES